MVVRLERILSERLKLDQSTPQSVINGAPYFVEGIKAPRIYPNADGTSSVQITKADGSTAIINIDTTNGNVILPVGYFDSKNYYFLDGNKLISIDGTGCLFFGVNAGKGNTATYSLGIGYNALGGAGAGCSGTGNLGIGYGALQNIVSGIYNIAIGIGALSSNVISHRNIGIGYNALYNTTGAANLAVGHEAGKYCSAGAYNVYFGYNAGLGVDGQANSYNVGIGYQSLLGVTTGGYNVALGSSSLKSTTTGVRNVALGLNALATNIGGNYNIAVGTGALQATSATDGSVAIGYQALINSVGAGCVAIGYRAGFYETGANKLFIANDRGSSEADGRIKSLVYGEFDATPANQLFRVNGNLEIYQDNLSLRLGAASDASIYYDGTDLIINPKVVGAGIVDILGDLQTDGYNAADGSPGIDTTFVDADGNTIGVKNGLVVSKTAP